MKRKINKILALIITVVVSLTNVSFLSLKVNAKATVKYEKCSICGENTIKVTTDEDSPTCTDMGSKVIYYQYLCGHGVDYDSGIMMFAPLGHDYTKTVVVEEGRVNSTCKDKGYHYTATVCSRCGKEDPNSTRQKVTDPLVSCLSLGAVEENRIDAKCTTAGSYNIVKRCQWCNKILESTNEIIYPLGHQKGDFIRYDIKTNCVSLGDALGEIKSDERGTKIEICECSRCHQEYECSACNHSLPKNEDEDHVIRIEVEPTCTEDGYDELILKCPDCEAVIEHLKSEITALGHKNSTPVIENRIEPSCTKDGHYDSVVYCSECHDELSREKKIIEQFGHTPLPAVEENRQEATCSEEGHYDSVVYCETCHEELSRRSVSIEKIPHASTEIINKKDSTMDEDGYSGDTICSVCKEVLSQGVVIPKLTEEGIDENKVAELLNNEIKLCNETQEELKELAKSSKESTIQIIDTANKTMSSLEESLKAGNISKEEYKEYVEKVNVIIDVTIKAANQKDEIEEKTNELEEKIPSNAGLNVNEKITEFYENQMKLLINEEGFSFDLETPIETYKEVLNFIVDSIEKMEDAALMIRECSNESFVEVVAQYINNVSVKSFKDFDKEKADEEFVEAAYQAILINMQSQVIESLTSTYNQAKSSGKYVGTSLVEFEEKYKEEMANVSDLESFEIMVTEVMRLKYIAKLEEKLIKGEISESTYNSLLSSSNNVDTFAPVYKEIFRSWALNSENEYGMTLEELSTATLDSAKEKLVLKEYSGTITEQDKVVIIGALGFGGVSVGSYVLFNILKKRKWRLNYE